MRYGKADRPAGRPWKKLYLSLIRNTSALGSIVATVGICVRRDGSRCCRHIISRSSRYRGPGSRALNKPHFRVEEVKGLAQGPVTIQLPCRCEPFKSPPSGLLPWESVAGKGQSSAQ